MDPDIPLPPGMEFPRLDFKPGQHFQTKLENGFYRPHRTRHGNVRPNDRLNRDGISAFLQSDGLEMSAIDKLDAMDISYSELACLQDEDLKLMGFKIKEERENLLEFFKHLPNQEPTFDEIISKPEAQQYNSIIMENLIDRLNCRHKILIETNLKMQINIPDDPLLGDRYYASRFVVATIAELDKAAQEVQDEVDALSEILNGKPEKPKKPWLTRGNWIMLTIAVGVTAVAAFWLIKIH